MQGAYEDDVARTAPIPVLSWEPDVPRTEPPVVRDVRILCILVMVTYGGLVSMGGYEAITASSSGKDAGGGLAIMTIYGMCLAVAITLYIGLKNRNRVAWVAQSVISWVGVFGFPVGTLIHYSILSRWFKPEVKTWFDMAPPPIGTYPR